MKAATAGLDMASRSAPGPTPCRYAGAGSDKNSGCGARAFCEFVWDPAGAILAHAARISLDSHSITVLLLGPFPKKIHEEWRRKGDSLNKGDLVAKIAKDAGITKAQAEKSFNSLIGSITASLKKNLKVTIVGFGTYSVARRKARVGRNPQTGIPIKIAAHKVPKFTPGSDLKKAVR
jgi:DNA-binding protein HU-beta